MVEIKNSNMVMRSVSVNVLKGNEIIAKDIISESGIILMSEGTVVKKEYIMISENKKHAEYFK